ncbi:MAG: ABC transporter ATP-binding protein, partial [Promethearchaeota archaeon]
MTAIVEFEEFTFRYPHMKQDLIKNASFTIEQGTLTLLHGLSGSGKSTLCYAMTGLIPWSVRGFFKGNVKLFGKNTNTNKPNQLAGKIGYLMQNPDSQFATLTVHDELIFAAENIRLTEDVIKKRLKSIIQLLDLDDYLNRNVTQLSSGEKQRVVLGSILMMGPSLLILDEPLSFLDFPNRLKLLKYLEKIHKSYSDLTIIIAEHRVQDLYALANFYLEIKEGRVTESPIVNEDSKKYHTETPESFTYRDLIQHYGFYEKSISKIRKKNQPILSFDGVTFNYLQDRGNFEQIITPILKNLSFNLYSGEIIAIIGPNGIGKTTLLYLIAGILHPSQGYILFKQQDVSELKYGIYSKNIGLIFQNPESQLLKNTIKKEIEFGPKNFQIQISEKDYRHYAQFIFPSSKTDPNDLLTLHPFNLSWGEKRRLNLTSLFAYSPSIYLFDEPFTGQDYLVRKHLLENIKSIAKSMGLVIISSHDEEI